LFKDVAVGQVNISAVSGDMGILASHVPSIEQLRPGIVEIIENAGSKKFFGKTFCSPSKSLFLPLGDPDPHDGQSLTHCYFS